MQNLKYYCRQEIEDLAAEQCKFNRIPGYVWTYYCTECK